MGGQNSQVPLYMISTFFSVFYFVYSTICMTCRTCNVNDLNRDVAKGNITLQQIYNVTIDINLLKQRGYEGDYNFTTII